MSSYHYDFILSKRSTLAKLWRAAHWERNLSKVQVFETNVLSSVHDILNLSIPIALRTSGHLLIGLVRIHSRKAKYLLHDCSKALVSIKVAFRPGIPAVDIPRKRKRANDVADCPFLITETVDLFDHWVPDLSNVEMDCSLHQSKAEEITIQEEPLKVSSAEDYTEDEGFGEMSGLETLEPELMITEAFPSHVDSFADSACCLDDITSVSDFSDPFSSLSPVKYSTPIKTSIFADEETEVPMESENNQGILLDRDEETESVVLSPIEDCPSPLKRTRRPRRRLKRKLLVDEVIFIDRETFVNRVKNPSTTLTGTPELAPCTKRKMNKVSQDVQSLFSATSLNQPLAPCLERLFERTCGETSSVLCKSDFGGKKSNAGSDFIFREEQEVAEEKDLNSMFIPIRDYEYSSDEDEANEDAMEEKAVKSGQNDIRFSTTEEFGSHEMMSWSPACEDEVFDQEDLDISQDEFCRSVEAAVHNFGPKPVTFDRVVRTTSGAGPLTRKDVARKFLKCLLMQREAKLRLEQDSSSSQIRLYPGPSSHAD